MSKKVVVYDASVVFENLSTTASRSGVFWVAVNLLRKFLACRDFKVLIYCRDYTTVDIAALKELLPGSASIDFPESANLRLRLIGERKNITHKRSLYKRKNFLLHAWYGICDAVCKQAVHALKGKMDYTTCSVFVSPLAAVPPEFARREYIKKFTVLYDVTPILFPQFFNERQVWFDDLLQSLNSRDYYFAISANTRKDFLQHCPTIHPDHITVTPLASANNYSRVLDNEETLRKKYKIPSGMKYVFSLSNLEPRKNLHMALKSFAVFIKKHNIEDLCFVLGGAFWKNYSRAYEDLLKELDVPSGRILPVGYVDDTDVAGLLSHAHWLVYTSKYEGFGMPPLEAMQCGCPVITSNNSSLPEVVGDAGLMIDCESEEQHVQAYEQYYFNHARRHANSVKGLEHAKKFTWDATFALVRKAILDVV